MSQDTPSRITLQDWVHYEQHTRGFVNSNFGGVMYRAFVSQLHPEMNPEVLLYTYSGVDGCQMVAGFLSADAADELADALKAAADKVRALDTPKITDGGSV